MNLGNFVVLDEHHQCDAFKSRSLPGNTSFIGMDALLWLGRPGQGHHCGLAVSAKGLLAAPPSRPRLKFSGETPEPRGLAPSYMVSFTKKSREL
jgi:hypothetical protein